MSDGDDFSPFVWLKLKCETENQIQLQRGEGRCLLFVGLVEKLNADAYVLCILRGKLVVEINKSFNIPYLFFCTFNHEYNCSYVF